MDAAERAEHEKLQPYDLDRDSQATLLRAQFRNIILEADEWRPLTDHIRTLVSLAEQAVREKALEEAARYGENLEWPAYVIETIRALKDKP